MTLFNLPSQSSHTIEGDLEGFFGVGPQWRNLLILGKEDCKILLLRLEARRCAEARHATPLCCRLQSHSSGSGALCSQRRLSVPRCSSLPIIVRAPPCIAFTRRVGNNCSPGGSLNDGQDVLTWVTTRDDLEEQVRHFAFQCAAPARRSGRRRGALMMFRPSCRRILGLYLVDRMLGLQRAAKRRGHMSRGLPTRTGRTTEPSRAALPAGRRARRS